MRKSSIYLLLGICCCILFLPISFLAHAEVSPQMLEKNSRFQLQQMHAEFTPEVSSNGRFALRAHAQVQFATTKNSSSRFTIKRGVECEGTTSADLMFLNGFE